MQRRVTVSIVGALTGALVSTGGITLLVVIQHVAWHIAAVTQRALPV